MSLINQYKLICHKTQPTNPLTFLSSLKKTAIFEEQTIATFNKKIVTFTLVPYFFHSFIFFFLFGASYSFSITVIVIGNVIGDLTSNSEPCHLHFTSN